jgi:hypothetical protein
MLSANQIYVTITESDGQESVCVAEVGYRPLDLNERIQFGLYAYDKHGLYFSHPDMAKHHAMDQLDNDYRDMMEAFVIPSMSGHERALLKKKAPKDKKKAERDDAVFWAAFNSWK